MVQEPGVINMNRTGGDELPSSHVYSILLLVFAMVVVVILLSPAITRDYLQMSPDTALIPFLRVSILVMFAVILFPSSFLIELAYAHWRKRDIRLLNVLISSAIMGEAVLLMIALSFAFDFAFPRLSLTNEPFSGLAGLVLGLIVGLPTLAIGLTSRIPKVREYIKKAFEL